ncbi:MAG: septation protein A [Neomegalonema sp.]|nr:septation protein A [Neomegalonema sp.]
MSQTPTPQSPTPQARKLNPLVKLVLEIGPLAAFFIAYRMFRDGGDEGMGEGELRAMLIATGTLMVTMAAAMGIMWAFTREISKMQIVTFVVVMSLGALTLLLGDKDFIKLKPTLVNLAFGGVLLVGILRGQSYLKYLLEELVPLREAGWRVLTRNWTIYFVAMAVLNEVIWRTQDDDTWVNAKTFLYLPITLVFTISQSFVMNRYLIEEEQEQA